jgi:2-succinyl-6-hydroxy-2,4-cyclohexadiene-1-carboxylate synthase
MVDLTLIHGFTQDSSVWERTRQNLPEDWAVTAVDLPGHGIFGKQRPQSPEEFLEQVGAILPSETDADRRVLCGYSMGARVALQLAAAEPERWTHLVVISSGAGMTDTLAREERRQSDEALAASLEEGWLEEFASHWDSLSIWEGDPAEVSAQRAEMILKQDPVGLACALRSFGQGVAPVFSGFASGDEPKLTVVRGERDTTYVRPTEELAMLGASSPMTIAGGHSLLIENPAAVAGVLRSL